MRLSSHAVLGTCAFALLTTFGVAQVRVPEPSAKLKAKLSAKTIAILKAPTKIEVFRLDPQYKGKEDVKHFIGYAIKSTGKDLDKEFGLKLAALLFQDKAWFNPDKFVLDHRAVGYRVWKDSEAVDVIYDITARLAIRPFGAKGQPFMGNCDPIHAPFLRLAAESLPDDPDLKAMVGRLKGK